MGGGESAELAKDPQWSDEDLKKLAGLNIIRVMKDVEAVSNDLPAMWGREGGGRGRGRECVTWGRGREGS